MSRPIILLAGTAGDLGHRVARAVLERGAALRILVRHDARTVDHSHLLTRGATLVRANVRVIDSVAAACEGADCVVSALNGLREVIVERQSVLLSGAALSGVRRLISSDFSADYTKTAPGRNRNFDLRREFMAIADRASISVTSILNGAFMDMLGAEMPIIQPRVHRVLYWRDPHQLLDFTTKDNVAAYTAEAALDPSTPRILRIAGDSISADGIAKALIKVTGQPYRTLGLGGIGSLGVLIRLAKLFAPQPSGPFPPWQGMQYMRDMFSGEAKLNPLDNDRYPSFAWTSVGQHLSQKLGGKR